MYIGSHDNWVFMCLGKRKRTFKIFSLAKLRCILSFCLLGFVYAYRHCIFTICIGSIEQGNVFIRVCHSIHRGSTFPQCHGQEDPPPPILLGYGYYYSIWSTNGWFASYWNAYLFIFLMLRVNNATGLHHMVRKTVASTVCVNKPLMTEYVPRRWPLPWSVRILLECILVIHIFRKVIHPWILLCQN